MKKIIPLLFLIFLQFSCATTKIYPRIKCQTCVSKSDGILLMPLQWDPSFRQLSTAQINELERMILEIFREEGFTQVELYDRMEYELLNAGIRDVNDPVQRAKINLELGIPYLLGLSLGESDWSGNWEAIDPDFPEAGTYWEEDTQVSSMLRIALFETAAGDIVSDYAVEATINGMPIPIGDGESLTLNFGSVIRAVSIATRKGIKNLVTDCSC
ncbi:hypothetical protein [Algoriphagus hitonicola]